MEKTSKNDSSIKRIYAFVKTGSTKSFYSFYPDTIIKTTDTAKELIYTVIYESLDSNFDRIIYQNFSRIDSIVLNNGDNFLDSLGLPNFKTSIGAQGFQISISYYHGYPKNKKFTP